MQQQISSFLPAHKVPLCKEKLLPCKRKFLTSKHMEGRLMLNYRRGVSRRLPEMTVGMVCVIAAYAC